jgi:BTB/POZ domain-containing protein 16
MFQMSSKDTEEQRVATHAETQALNGSRQYTLPSPTRIFHYHSQKAVPNKGPDVLLLCHGITWELHKPYIQKSHTLSSLLQHQVANPPTIDRDIPLLRLPLIDPHVTRQALARALGLLYEDQLTVSSDEVISLLAAASLLAYPELERECCEVMLRSINCHTVSVCYSVCTKYKQLAVQEACERWLQLHIVPQLSLVINLQDLSFELLEKTLLSNRLFTWNEYALFKLICHWIFLQLHPSVQIMPAHSFVVTYFQNLSKLGAFLQSEKGHPFASLFNCIRLENITEAAHLDEMERMNILPVSRMLQLFKLHHLVLHSGGDMACVDQFDRRAARVGFIVEQELRSHVETISLYGFHFKAKAEWSEQTESFNLTLKRLRPGDPALSMHTSEKEPVSLRASRQVCYSAELLYRRDGEQRTAKKGEL